MKREPEPLLLPVVGRVRRRVASSPTAVVERSVRRPRMCCGGCGQVVELGSGDRFCGYCGVRLA
jgi:rRNA maturation endonuclease Nob1